MEQFRKPSHRLGAPDDIGLLTGVCAVAQRPAAEIRQQALVALVVPCRPKAL